jgi:hypothetical protein
MKFPDLPRKGQTVIHSITQIINYLRSSRVLSINGVTGSSSTNGTVFNIPVGDHNTDSIYPHPFKMFAKKIGSESRLYIKSGAMTSYVINGDGTPGVVNLPIQFADGVSDLSNTDFPQYSVEGYFVLAASKTYGVWIVGNDYKGSPAPETDITDYTTIRTYAPVFTDLPYVYITDISDQIAIGDEPNVVLGIGTQLTFYIGQVITDADTKPTIKQWRKSDIFAQMTVLPYNFVIVSEDTNNSITAGTDGKAFYNAPPFASADANNSISTGSDGGPFYDAP